MPKPSHSPLPAHAISKAPRDGGPSFSALNRLTRVLWNLTWLTLASWTPSGLHRWRRMLLVMFGARMGHRADVRGSARVWLPQNLSMADHALIGPRVNCYNQAMITLGERALVSQGVHMCSGTHDFEHPDFPLFAKPITIGDHAWIAADAFLGPGCVVGSGAVVGARSVAVGHLSPWTVYAGNPARPLKARIWRPEKAPEPTNP